MSFLKVLYRWLLKKFFKKEVELLPEDATLVFLRSFSRLAKQGQVKIFRGGQRAFTNALMDPDKITYILTVHIGKSKQKLEDKIWFEQYLKRERDLL